MEKQKNELTTAGRRELAVKLEGGQLGEMLKPLIREIYLFDSYVAGTLHLADKTILDQIKVGDKLLLQREENRFDENAIMIMTEDGRKLGYIPEKDNVVFARLMDAGKMLTARIKTIDRKGDFRQIGIGIYLVDF